MPFEVQRVNHECKTCKNKTTFKTPKGYFCRICIEVEPYPESEKPEPETKVEIMQDNIIEEKPVEQVSEMQETVVEPSQQSIEDVSES